MNKTFPENPKAGDEVRVIAPSRSLAIISPESREIANERFEELGLKLSFGNTLKEWAILPRPRLNRGLIALVTD